MSPWGWYTSTQVNKYTCLRVYPYTISIFVSQTSPSVQFASTHFATLCRDCRRVTASELTIAQAITASCHLSCKSISATETLNSRCKREISGLIRPRFSLSEEQVGRCRWIVRVASIIWFVEIDKFLSTQQQYLVISQQLHSQIILRQYSPYATCQWCGINMIFPFSTMYHMRRP